jgi:hypothetical protein
MPAVAAAGRPVLARRSRHTPAPVCAVLVSRRVVDFVRITASGC